MSDTELLDVLRKLHLFEGVSEESLQQLATIARFIDVPAGTTIFRQGETATTVYFLVSGRVSLEICAPGIGCKRILTVHEGDLLGWSPVLENEKLTATARTLLPTRMIAMDGKEIHAECEKYPRLGHEFMRRTALALGKRLNATRLQLLNLYGDELPESPASTESGETS